MGLIKIWFGIALVLACSLTYGKEYSEKGLQILNDDNFEHLTQASTGATTGDWLIMMTKDKKCTDCDKLEEKLVEVATMQEGRMNVAKLDPKTSRLTVRRFKVSKRPTLIFFRLGMQWTYKGDLNSKKINDFVTDGYMRHNGHPVIPPLDSIDVWKEDFVKEVKAALKEGRLPERNVLLILLGGLLAAVMLLCGFAAAKEKKEEKDKKE